MSKVIVLATPVFLLLIALEFCWGRARAARAAPKPRGTGQHGYRLNDAINSISLGILSQLGGVLSKALTIGIYTAVFAAIHTSTLTTAVSMPTTEFWSSWYGMLAALVFYDLCYYWLHRGGHRVAVLWAAHVVHHQSQHYNLSTALRQTSSGALLGWVFYLPMALAGVPPLVFAIVALVDLLYQFWVHTEQVGKLGWFDRWFCSPSNHRVHHAVNDGYVDKNYGGILIVWDRLFGTFQEELEHERCVYGTRGPLNSWDPLWANVAVYWQLAQASWHTRHWGDKLRVWLKPPGWQPADLALSHPTPRFRLDAVTTYNPPLNPAQQGFVGAQFVLALGAVSWFLWNADAMPLTHAALWVVAIAASLWGLGLYMQGRLAWLEVLVLQTAALATLGAVELLPGYLFFKPMPMALAICFVAAYAVSARARGQFVTKNYALLGAALLFSLVGDVLLMLPGNYFIPGLAAFLVAHGFYIALLRQGQTWLPSRTALLAVLCVGALMYAVLWSSLGDPVLKGAVAAYVVVISLMAAQALGRARVLQSSNARWVAVGACIFMLSDSLLAVDKFLTPLPWAPLWILASYFAAQMLIVHFVLEHTRFSQTGA